MRYLNKCRNGFTLFLDPRNFTITNRGIIILPKIRVNKGYSTVKSNDNIISKSKDSIIAKGKIIPGENDYHKGLWIFQFPDNENDVLSILYRMFVTDKIDERMHDNCGFINHFPKYVVVCKGRRLGTIEEVLNYN